MTPEALLKRAEAQRVLRRASRIARTALTVHRQGPSGEAPRVTGCGKCAEACAYVQELPWGAQACRKSRETPSFQALKRDRPVPFICHMGFACVAAPVLPATGAQLAVTFGPFVPAESPDSLERDALEGLARLDREDRDTLPFTLTDIPSVPAEVPAEVAQWLGETLAEQLAKGAANAPAAELSDPAPVRRNKPGAAVRDAFGARAILAAMAGPAAPLRALVLDQLQSPSGSPLKAAALRARAVAIASATIEAAELSASVPPEARARLADLPAVLAQVERADAACRAVLKTFSPIRRKQLRRSNDDTDLFTKLEQFIADRLASDLTLADAAQHLGLTPSTLTRRIQRRFQVTFTGYVARQRLARAKSMLQRTALSVDTIAKRAGFTDGAHLRKQLQRFEGTTPSEVRDRRKPNKAAG